MLTVAQFCAECQKERKRFSTESDKHSPGCAGLWRLAIKSDDDAWTCIKALFEPWLTRSCEAAVNAAPKRIGLSRQDVPDLVQDVWHNLWRYVVRNQTAALDLLTGDDISRVIGLLKTTTKHRVIELGRKPHGYEDALPDDNPPGEETGERVKPHPILVQPDVDGVLDLLAFLRKHIRTEQEQTVAEMIFLQGMKPQDVFDLRTQQFMNVGEVNQVRQNIIRRLNSDPTRQKLIESASLHFRLDPVDEAPMQEKPNSVEPCPFAEDILFDYIHGQVDGAIQVAIERSPICIQAVTALRAALAAWQPYLRQLFCPTGDRLTAYQERHLTGADYLVVHNHVQRCPYCQAELQMLAAIDNVPSELQPSLARRLYELIFQPATLAPVPILGEGSYHTIERTPQIELLVRTVRTAGKQGKWMVIGRLRYEGDQPFTQVESIVLQDIEEPDAPELSTTIDEQGGFTLKEIDAGLYRLRILTTAEEIILREFKIGEALS